MTQRRRRLRFGPSSAWWSMDCFWAWRRWRWLQEKTEFARSPRKSECDQCWGGIRWIRFCLCDELVLERSSVLVHLAARNLFSRRIREAQLADGEMSVFIAHGRTKGAALHRPGSVEIASTCCRVEHRTGLVIGKLFEGLFMMRLREEDSGNGVSRKAGGEQTFPRSMGS